MPAALRVRFLRTACPACWLLDVSRPIASRMVFRAQGESPAPLGHDKREQPRSVSPATRLQRSHEICVTANRLSGGRMGASLLAAAEAATALVTSQWEPAPSHWEGCDFPVGASQIPLGNPTGSFSGGEWDFQRAARKASGRTGGAARSPHWDPRLWRGALAGSHSAARGAPREHPLGGRATIGPAPLPVRYLPNTIIQNLGLLACSYKGVFKGILTHSSML